MKVLGYKESVSFKADRERIEEILDAVESRLISLGISEKDCKRSRHARI